jgi:hypothetical protein
VKRNMSSSCNLSPVERRLYCAKKRVSKTCLKPWFLGHRCPYLQWSKLDVMREAKKGKTEIISKSGFSEEAIKYAEKYRPYLRLIHGNKTVKPRRLKR